MSSAPLQGRRGPVLMIAVTRSLRVSGWDERGALRSPRLGLISMGGVVMAMSIAMTAVDAAGRLSSRLR